MKNYKKSILPSSHPGVPCAGLLFYVVCYILKALKGFTAVSRDKTSIAFVSVLETWPDFFFDFRAFILFCQNKACYRSNRKSHALKGKYCIGMTLILLLLAVHANADSLAGGQKEIELTLVKNQMPAASIVIGKKATRSAQFAALELQYHIEKITGVRLPVVRDSQPTRGTSILVGESKATKALGLHNADFQPQEYLILFRPGTLVLMGRDKPDIGIVDYNQSNTFPGQFEAQATCYAVYDFLERYCNVRWYLPTEAGLVLPQQHSLVVQGRHLRRTPVMKYRELYSLPLMPASLSDEPGPPLSTRDAALFAHRWRLTGVQPYACNHAFYGYYNRYLKDHPDWFAKGYDINTSQKTGTSMQELYPNMCYTNPSLIQHVIQRARNYFDTGVKEGGEQAAGDFFSLGPMDSVGKDKMCKCPECKKLIHEEPPCNAWRKQPFFWDDRNSDYIFGFVNKVAKEVAKTHPDKYLTMFAYHQTYYPPTREPLEPNVAISFCIHALLRAVPAMDQAVTELLNKWDDESKTRPKYLWLYFHRPGPVNPFFPAFMPHHIAKQMKDYNGRGFRGIFVEPPYFANPGEKGKAKWAPIVNQLELYITFKLADDPTLDGDQIIDEFFSRYYGSAAEPMQSLYEKMEHVYCDPVNYSFNPKSYFGYQSKDIAWGKLGTTKRMAEFGALMAEAKKVAKTDAEKKRVDIFERSVWKPMQAAHEEYMSGYGRSTARLKDIMHRLYN